MALKDKLDILFTGYRNFTEEQASVIVSQRVHGVSNAVMVNNGVTELKDSQKNKIASINCDKKEIIPNELVTYTVKLDEKDKDRVKTEIKQVNFCLWFQSKDESGEIKKIEIDKKVIPAGVVKVAKRNTSPRVTNIFEPREDKGETLTSNLESAYYYANITYTENEAKLEIKYSKWMDGCRIRVEAFFSKILQDGKDTTASRWVKANPEILDTYWLNATGERVHSTGYDQDLYLYIKSLGLQGETIEVQVHEEDYYNSPSDPKIFLSGQRGDELIEWKNNQIKIDSNGEALKQFKVGNKERYEEAQKDEANDEYNKRIDEYINNGTYTVLQNFKEKDRNDFDLELYIHFPQQDSLKLDIDNQFANLNLTVKEQITNAYFAKVKEQEVQGDIKPTKKNPNPTKKVINYQKLGKGVLGQTVQLVAECPNLEGQDVTFQVFEKTPLLGEKDKPLTLVYKEKEESRIEAKVKEGYAVAEVKLQHCKEYKDNEDWLDLLKNGFYDDDSKTSHLYIKVEATESKNIFKVLNNNVFLEKNSFELIGNNWHEPVDDPQIAIYTQYGAENTHKNTYGTARGYTHAGLDIFSLEGSNVYACLDGEVYEIQKWTRKTGDSGYGHNVTLKVKTPQEVRNRRREYTLAYKKDKKQGSSFNPNSNIFYLRYAHLEDILVKKGDKIKAGQVIAKSGISGVIDGTKDPHVHFNIYSDVKSNAYLVNPAYYVYWKEIGDLTETDKKVQKDRMEEGLKIDPAPKLSKIK